MNIITGFHHLFVATIHWSQTAASAPAAVADAVANVAVTAAVG